MTVLDALLDSRQLQESFEETAHPRDFLGRFKSKLAGLKVGGKAQVPGGITVTRKDGGFHISGGAGLGHYKHSSGEFRTGKPAAEETLSSPQSAAMLAVTRSLRSRDPKSFGGDRHYQSLDDYEKSHGKLDETKARQVEDIQREYRTAGEAVIAARKNGDPKVVRKAEQRWTKAKDRLRTVSDDQRAAYARARPNAFK